LVVEIGGNKLWPPFIAVTLMAPNLAGRDVAATQLEVGGPEQHYIELISLTGFQPCVDAMFIQSARQLVGESASHPSTMTSRFVRS
jgi:hypothetical protein